jgi:Flp pilus assembly secretin CpaC
MRATQVINVITNFAFQEEWTNQDGTIISNSVVPQTAKVETGPVLDVIPFVLADGYTINLTVIPSLTEFLGYDKSTNIINAVTRAGETVRLPTVLPRFRVQQASTHLRLWDNQTAVLMNLPAKVVVGGQEVSADSKRQDKEIVVFITATLVDPVGNRLHTDDQLPFARTGAPPQPY